jgi:hypothetical protein
VLEKCFNNSFTSYFLVSGLRRPKGRSPVLEDGIIFFIEKYCGNPGIRKTQVEYSFIIKDEVGDNVEDEERGTIFSLTHHCSTQLRREACQSRSQSDSKALAYSTDPVRSCYLCVTFHLWVIIQWNSQAGFAIRLNRERRLSSRLPHTFDSPTHQMVCKDRSSMSRS